MQYLHLNITTLLNSPWEHQVRTPATGDVNHQAVFWQLRTQRLKELGACSVSCHCFEKTSTQTLCPHKQSVGMLPNDESWASEPDVLCCGPVCAPAWPEDKTGKPVHGKSHVIMYIYHVLINVLSTNMLHINLSTIFCMHVEHSSTETIYISIIWKHTQTHTHTHTHRVSKNTSNFS